mgnify:CR=1 FL=1
MRNGVAIFIVVIIIALIVIKPFKLRKGNLLNRDRRYLTFLYRKVIAVIRR